MPRNKLKRFRKEQPELKKRLKKLNNRVFQQKLTVLPKKSLKLMRRRKKD